MKGIIKFWLLGLLTCNVAIGHAQMGAVENFFPAQTSLNSIVKIYNGGINVVSYYSLHQDYSSFAFVDHNNIINELLIEDVEVTDFVIDDDTVFFCGRNNLYDKGVVGFFDINTAMNNSDDIIISDELSSFHNYPIYNFKKIITYKEPNMERKLYCISENNLMEIRPYTNDSSNHNCTIWNSGLPFTHEIFMDIEFMSPYIIVASMQYGPDTARSIVLRGFRVYDNYFSSPNYYKYIYPSNATTYWLDKDVKLQAIDSYSKVVMAAAQRQRQQLPTLSTNSNNDNEETSTIIAEFLVPFQTYQDTDILTLTNAVKVPMSGSYANMRPLDLAWITANDELIVIHGNNDFYMFNAEEPEIVNYYYRVPFQSTLSDGIYDASMFDRNTIQSIDYSFVDNQYILGGIFFGSDFPEYMKLISETPQSINSCLRQFVIGASLTNLEPTSPIPEDSNVIPNKVHFIVKTATRMQSGAQIECQY